ncbi:unnamed protein product [Rotaria sp. Silwood2]|nr:unnamed protein product [Rotaria sp. Silwood2]CAF4461751.1 unnamed protein product [Rotaria sp. Silwood2]CAF4574030.1 unnamed protein product [Rotaria sp. Silwood2]
MSSSSSIHEKNSDKFHPNQVHFKTHEQNKYLTAHSEATSETNATTKNNESKSTHHKSEYAEHNAVRRKSDVEKHAHPHIHTDTHTKVAHEGTVVLDENEIFT